MIVITLEKYEKVLGKKMNKEKSAIYLNNSVTRGDLLWMK